MSNESAKKYIIDKPKEEEKPKPKTQLKEDGSMATHKVITKS